MDIPTYERAGCILCQRIIRNRGLCGAHYSQFAKRVRAGETTWAALVAEGKALDISPKVRAKQFNNGLKIEPCRS